MYSTTRFLALIGTCVSLHALCSLVFLLDFQALDYWILSIPWFLLNLAAQILCLLVFHQFDSLIGLQDDVNWLASAVGWPCLTTFFLIKGQEASWLFILFHPIMALGLLGLFVKTKCAFKGRKSPFDLTKASVTMASLCTLSLTASCYKSNDLTGLSACFAFILSNFALATNLTVFKDWSPLDFFLLGNTASNYLFTLAIIEKEVA